MVYAGTKKNLSLLAIHASTPVRSIAGVIRIMTEIEHLLPQEDGLWWFNWLYRQVTIAIREECDKQAWRAPVWVTHLDVEFGKLYFSAIVAWEKDPVTCPRAWRPLFEARHARYLAPVQYALAGLCAHINRDLPVAAVRASERTGSILRRNTREERDYNRINEILYEVELRCLQELTTGWIRVISSRMDPYDRRLAITVVRWMRDLAWSHAEAYAKVLKKDPDLATGFVERLDRVTELVARGTLVPTTWRREAALPRGDK